MEWRPLWVRDKMWERFLSNGMILDLITQDKNKNFDTSHLNTHCSILEKKHVSLNKTSNLSTLGYINACFQSVCKTLHFSKLTQI
jgi:hypothetical protein